MKKEIESKEIEPLKKEVGKLESLIVSVEINTDDEYKNAIDIISKLKESGSKLKNIKESITKPLNDALKNARSLFSPLEQQLTNAESELKSKIIAYKKKKDEEAKKEEDRVAARLEKGTMKLETAEKKISNIQRVEKTTRGSIGEVQIKKIKKVRITDVKLLPIEYMVPNEVLIRKDALGGKQIPGVEVYEEETVSAR